MFADYRRHRRFYIWFYRYFWNYHVIPCGSRQNPHMFCNLLFPFLSCAGHSMDGCLWDSVQLVIWTYPLISLAFSKFFLHMPKFAILCSNAISKRYLYRFRGVTSMIIDRLNAYKLFIYTSWFQKLICCSENIGRFNTLVTYSCASVANDVRGARKCALCKIYLGVRPYAYCKETGSHSSFILIELIGYYSTSRISCIQLGLWVI